MVLVYGDESGLPWVGKVKLPGGNIRILGILQYSWILKFLVFGREGDDLELRIVVQCENARDAWVEEVIGC
jgi:hypothetical protein